VARVYRRGKVWHAFGYDAAGVRWRESTGQHDRRAAEAIAIEIERRRASRASEPPSVKLIDALDALLAQDERAHRSAATIEIHTLKGRHLLRVFGPAFDLHHVSRSACTRYADQRVSEGASRHCVHMELATLRRACTVSEVPWSRAYMPEMGTVYTPRKAWLTHDQARALLAVLSPEQRDAVTCVLLLGVRKGELARLEARHLDHEREAVHVPGTKTEGALRWVPAHRDAWEVLTRRAKARPSGPLFGPWENMTRDLARACKRAGVPRVSANDLRRTFVSWLANESESPLTVARLAGHTSTRMVERVYAQLGIGVQRGAVSKLPDMHTGVPNTPAPDALDGTGRTRKALKSR
jgi:integrase